MARKHDTKLLKQKIEEMMLAEVGPKEILRRLQEDDCGIGYRVDIGIRSVQYHLKKIKDQRARETTQRATLTETAGATKLAAAELLRRELHAIERQPSGKITYAQVGVVERIHKALDSIGRREHKAAARPSTNGSSPSEKLPESALEQLARQEQEHQGSGVLTSRPDLPSSPQEATG